MHGETIWVTDSGSLGSIAHNRRWRENRDFVSWDGEGINTSDGHKYVLFGSSAGEYVMTKAGRLTTIQCLETLRETKKNNPNAIHVAFAFDYDVNMIISDLPANKLRRLHETGVVRWNEWRLEWRKGKWFSVSWPNGRTDKKGTTKEQPFKFGTYSPFLVARSSRLLSNTCLT